jgi:hypothetical protein
MQINWRKEHRDASPRYDIDQLDIELESSVGWNDWRESTSTVGLYEEYGSVSCSAAHEVGSPTHIIRGGDQRSLFAQRQLWDACVRATYGVSRAMG